MIKRFIFDDVDSRSLGVYIVDKKIYGAPVADVEYISIPGKSGDLIRDKKRFENIQVVYSVNIMRDIPTKIKNIKAWLYKTRGYVKLWDTYDPEYFRWASFSAGFDPSETNGIVTFDIAFNCKPHRYRNTVHDEYIIHEVTESSLSFVVVNPEAISSRPLIQLSGTSGYVNISGLDAGEQRSIYVSAIDSFVNIDAETQNAYMGTENKNNTVNTADFELYPGRNQITVSGGISRIWIEPRWRTL